MGYKTVAVFLNDHMHEIEKDSTFGKRLGEASNSFHTYGERKNLFYNSLGGNGKVVSVTHVSDTPVLVIQDYTGYDIREEKNDKTLMENDEFQSSGLPAMKDFLERNGYKVSKRRLLKKA